MSDLSPPTRAFLPILLTLLLSIVTITVAAEDGMRITKATWNAKGNSLQIRGDRAGRRVLVRVKDAGSGASVGSVRADIRGRWRLVAKQPSPVPCAVKAGAGERSAQRKVSLAPKDCGAMVQTAAAVTTAITISEAKWNAGDRKLVAKGANAGRRATVIILDANSGERLTSTRASSGGEWEIERGLAEGPCRIRAEASGAGAELTVSGAPAACQGGGGTPPPGGITGSVRILANNDLGMHCADQDYRIFSILPPYNVIGAQVVSTGANPRLMTPADGVTLSYQAAPSNIVDPNDSNAPPSVTDSLNSTSANGAGVYKGNFWSTAAGGIDPNGFLAFDPLYPPGVLGAFPFITDLGLPAPDVARLYLGDGALHAEQAAMPGQPDPYRTNEPQPFKGYAEDFPFFTNQGFGYVARAFKRYLAEGIPILPVDDAGRGNSYPLMRVQAQDASGTLLAEVDTVVPVASEADCQGCHLDQQVCIGLGLGIPCDDIANWYDRGATLITGDNIDTSNPGAANHVPGETPEQIALNAAKINILRVHDARYGTALDSDRHVVCATCHYSPALDLAQLGPSDSNGKEQTRHVSMSRAMHGFHGNLPNDRANDPDGVFVNLFPTMPPPSERTADEQDQILAQTCYNCHPGKRTKCLRGAMETGGMVCQDCHGQGTQVGADFTASFPTQPGNSHPDLRVPWAEEPRCQSCHVGDVNQVRDLMASGALADTALHARDKSGNTDGLRLELAYALSDHKANGGADRLTLLDFPGSRFASNLPLYRLSGGDDGAGKGHGGLSCEGCHGSTHAIWPNANPWANDNKTAMDLQGHTGTLVECTTCHEGDLGTTLGGPHGMHPVGDTRFSKGGHEHLAEQNKDACRACHGRNGEGTVLSRALADRTLTRGEGGSSTVHLSRGQPVTCRLCHENKL